MHKTTQTVCSEYVYITGGLESTNTIRFCSGNCHKLPVPPCLLLFFIRGALSLLRFVIPGYVLWWCAGFGRCDWRGVCSSDEGAVWHEELADGKRKAAAGRVGGGTGLPGAGP